MPEQWCIIKKHNWVGNENDLKIFSSGKSDLGLDNALNSFDNYAANYLNKMIDDLEFIRGK